MKRDETIVPDWRWGTPEGSRDLDRLLDRRLTFREKLEWLEEAETLTLQLRSSRNRLLKSPAESK
jgi:hypothetical protein